MSEKYMPLKKVCDIIMGQSPSGSSYNSNRNGLPFFQGKTEFGEEYPTAVKWCSSPKKIAQAGDILITVRAPVGSVNIAKEECCIGRGLAAIRPKPKEMNRDFLLFQLKYLEQHLIKKGQGSTFQAIGGDELRDLEIYTPTLMEQEKIALRLKTQLEEIKKARKAALMNKKDISIFFIRQQQMVFEILDKVKRVPLNDLLEGIEAGKSLKTSELPAKEDELGILKVSAVSWNKFQPNEAKSITGNYEPPKAHRVKKGDFIISRANTVELVGAVVLVDADYPNRLLSDKTLRLKLNTQIIIPEYLLQILKLSEARQHIELNATGSSNSMRNISQKTICSIPVPLATELQQKQIIQIMKETQENLINIDEALIIILENLSVLPEKLFEPMFKN